VPYRISPFEHLLKDPKNTVKYDHELAGLIEQRVAGMGSDGKLILDTHGNVYLVNLFEKLLVPLLCKLSNLVIDGGIWLNTQRPEWNDANNALVGQGLSMVTLYYMRRYVLSLQQLLAAESAAVELSGEVSQWLLDTAMALSRARPLLGTKPISPADRYRTLEELGQAASRYRESVYRQASLSGSTEHSIEAVKSMLDDALAAIDHSISTNERDDGLYHAYNLMDLHDESISVDTLYPMLEGQVAALSAGVISPDKAADLLEALFESDIYRPDQQSFMLYPDRALPAFLSKNRVPAADVEAIPLLQRMLSEGNERIVVQDPRGCFRFNADFRNVGDLNAQLNSLSHCMKRSSTTVHLPAVRAACSDSKASVVFTGTWCPSFCWPCRRTFMLRLIPAPTVRPPSTWGNSTTGCATVSVLTSPLPAMARSLLTPTRIHPETKVRDNRA
jgi:hypothetical protein